MRGENWGLQPRIRHQPGTSPRARGKLYANAAQNCVAGNIPACAGKTSAPHRPVWYKQEHPRVRGENQQHHWPPLWCNGTSPRARGKHQHVKVGLGPIRNIPACAGKTANHERFGKKDREHPRVRGENGFRRSTALPDGGTSPRARGKPTRNFVRVRFERNIPACAGKTDCLWGLIGTPQEHPRVRGENRQPATAATVSAGTSPRARGKPAGYSPQHGRYRNIPACAGKTPTVPNGGIRRREHPRVRGENNPM